MKRNADGSKKEGRRQVIVQLVTWGSLVHDAFQITIASVATASQVASAGAPRSAMFINAIEVSALVFVKMFNLYTWSATWKEQHGSETLRRTTWRIGMCCKGVVKQDKSMVVKAVTGVPESSTARGRHSSETEVTEGV